MRLENFDVANYFDDMLEAVETARKTLAGDDTRFVKHSPTSALEILTNLVTLILQDAGIDVPGAPEPTDSCEDSI